MADNFASRISKYDSDNHNQMLNCHSNL